MAKVIVPGWYRRRARRRGVDPVRSWWATMLSRARQYGVPLTVAREAIARGVDPVRSWAGRKAANSRRQRKLERQREQLAEALRRGVPTEFALAAVRDGKEPIKAWRAYRRKGKRLRVATDWPEIKFRRASKRAVWVGVLARRVARLAREIVGHAGRVELIRREKYVRRVVLHVDVFLDELDEVVASALARALQVAAEKLLRERTPRYKVRYRFLLWGNFAAFVDDAFRSKFASRDKPAEIPDEIDEATEPILTYRSFTYQTPWFTDLRMAEARWLGAVEGLMNAHDAEHSTIDAITLELARA